MDGIFSIDVFKELTILLKVVFGVLGEARVEIIESLVHLEASLVSNTRLQLHQRYVSVSELQEKLGTRIFERVLYLIHIVVSVELFVQFVCDLGGQVLSYALNLHLLDELNVRYLIELRCHGIVDDCLVIYIVEHHHHISGLYH